MDCSKLILTGTNIVITFKNNLCLSGIVDGWVDNVLILGSGNSNNKMLIYNFEENVMFVKIILDEEEEHQENKVVYVKNSTDVIEEPTIDIKKEDTADDIIEKHKERVTNLRQKVAAHMSRGPHEISHTYDVGYEYPDFSK
jgi:hypothetical protein